MARSPSRALIRTEFAPMEREIRAWFEESLTGPERGEIFADFAIQSLAEVQNINRAAIGYIPPHETRIDNMLADDNRASLARAERMIEFDFQLTLEVYEWIMDMLQAMSPVGHGEDDRPGHPGLYQRSHVMVVDNVQMDPSSPIPATANEIAFVNTVPYARKIERGLSRQFPEGVYQSVALLARERYHNIANVRFSYRSPLFGAVNQWANTTTMVSRYRHKGRAREDWLRRQPAVVVTPHRTGSY